MFEKYLVGNFVGIFWNNIVWFLLKSRIRLLEDTFYKYLNAN